MTATAVCRFCGQDSGTFVEWIRPLERGEAREYLATVDLQDTVNDAVMLLEILSNKHVDRDRDRICGKCTNTLEDFVVGYKRLTENLADLAPAADNEVARTTSIKDDTMEDASIEDGQIVLQDSANGDVNTSMSEDPTIKNEESLSVVTSYDAKNEPLIPKSESVWDSGDVQLGRGQDQDQFPCDNCGKTYRKRFLGTHRKLCRQVGGMSCDYCGKVFVHKTRLFEHVGIHHGGPVNEITCGECNKIFRRIETFNMHMESHKGDLFPCSKCSKMCNSRFQLKNHFSAVHPEQKQSCPVCRKTFNTKGSMLRHKKDMHINEMGEYVKDSQ